MKKLAILFVCAATSFAADPELMKLVMPDARVVSGIHLAQVKKTPFGQFLLAQFSASQDKGFDEFVKASGFDPRNNLDEIVMASPGGANGSRRLVLARGSFAPERILELARNAGGTVAAYQGIDMLSNERAASASPNGIPMAVAFLSNSVAVAGDADSVREAIGRRQTGPGPTQAVASKIKTVSTSSDAWFVSTVPISELAQGLPDTNLSGALKGDVLKSIGEASGGVVFGDVVKLSAELVTGSAEDAAGLASVLKFLAGFALAGRPNGAQNPAAGLLNTLDLKPEGNLLKCGLSIPEAQLETLLRHSTN